MFVNDVMTPHAECTRPTATLKEAAEQMKRLDVGALPVCDNDRLIGMVTDRDITLRAVAEGRDPRTTRIDEVMSMGVTYCYEDQSVHEAAEMMEREQIRRLVVLDREKRLAGIISLGDLAVRTRNDELSGEALERISEPAVSIGGALS